MDLTGYFKYVLGTSNMVRVTFDDVEYARVDRGRDDGGALADYRGQSVGHADLEQGRVPEQVFVDLTERFGKRDKGLAEKTGLDVLIATHTLCVTEGAQRSGRRDAIVAIPAKLSKDGGLACGADWRGTSPWIPRDFLDESGIEDAGRTHRGGSKESAVFLGKMASYLQFIRSGSTDSQIHKVQQATPETQWGLYMGYCESLYRSVVTTSSDTLENAGLSIDDESVYVVVNDRVNASQAIEALYAEIAQNEGDSRLELYRAMTRLSPHRQVDASADSNLKASMLTHAGTMGREYPLALRQRLAVHKHAELRDGQVLAVSGPPGTGKTTLLQSIVADLLVTHAISGKPAPVIVGASTNNQAVTNIITSFGEVAQDEGTSVYRRWLPDIDPKTNDVDAERPLRSFGAYSPSMGKQADAKDKGYLVSDITRPFETLYGICSGYDYEDEAKQLYVAQACAYLRETADTVKGLHNDILAVLRQVERLRRCLVESVFSGGSQDERKRIVNLLNASAGLTEDKQLTLEDCEDPSKLDAALDTKVRPLEFWLAVHFYEGEWLCSKWLEEGQLNSKRNRLTKREQRIILRSQLACVTPLQVMTLYRLPGQMAYPVKLGAGSFSSGYEFAGVDLLIVDEAGQVDTAVGAAAFSLAKRAVVVGDVCQLPPVWGIEDEVDAVVARHYAEPDEDWEELWQLMYERGLSASDPSSLMAAAQAACPWSHSYKDEARGEVVEEGGLFLSEHRRCLDDIIRYCNDLIYGGQLEPMRGSKPGAETGLPAMGFCAVEGKAVPAGTSRKNDAEARAVARWIKANIGLVYKAFDEASSAKEAKDRAKDPTASSGHQAPDPKKLIAVVTPFSSQASEVAKQLGKLGKVRLGEEEYPLRQLITVGTAHKLQGAECPVVLFSLVYDAGSSASFVQSNPNLMNVAVSRAKDSFIVFGSEELLRAQRGRGVLPLLKHYCMDNRVELPVEEPKAEGRKSRGAPSGRQGTKGHATSRKGERRGLRNESAGSPASAKHAAVPPKIKGSSQTVSTPDSGAADGYLSATKMLGEWVEQGRVAGGQLNPRALNELLKRHGVIERVGDYWKVREEWKDRGVKDQPLKDGFKTYPVYSPAAREAIYHLIFD